MSSHSERLQESQLKRLARVKSTRPYDAAPIGPELIDFFKHSVQRRQTKMATIADFWSRLVPEMLNDHCALESFSRGTLTVFVDGSSYLYQLKQLLLAGLQLQLLLACRSTGLKKISLKPGRWYEGTETDRKLRFDR